MKPRGWGVRATIFLDFETRSAIDLIKLGATRYAMDETTQVLCMSWLFGDQLSESPDDVPLWHRRHPWCDQSERPDELIERIYSGELVEAHNARFEFLIWNECLLREYPEFGGVKIKLDQLRCSAAKASCVSLPRSLGDACIALNLPIRKDTDGGRLITKLSKPMRRKKGQVGFLWCEEEIEHRRNWRYNQQDVRAERGLSDAIPEMSDRELDYWRMDFRMSERGIALSQDDASEAIKICERETLRLNAEMYKITGGRVEGGSKRIPFRKWANEQLELLGGDPLPDTRADTLSFALYGVPTKAGDDAKAAAKGPTEEKWNDWGEGGKPIHRAMEICLEVNRSSVAKYRQMVDSVCPDGRLHDIMLYNGADRTGRWSGKGVQPHNFVRGYTKDMPDVWQVLRKYDDSGFIELVTGDLMLPAMAKACRGALVASPGKELYAADFNAIEARKLAWMSGCASLLTLFQTGGDPYCDMASAIYKREITKADKTERQMGKKCFAAETLVLTNRGVMPIVQVRSSDLLWDGVEWVTHAGLVSRGMKPVVSVLGTWATPEHPVFVGDQQFRWGSLAHDARLRFRALEYALVNLPSVAMFTACEGVSLESSLVVRAVRRFMKFYRRIYRVVDQHVAQSARGQWPVTGEKTFGDMPILCRMMHTVHACLIGYRRSRGAANERLIRTTATMAHEELGCGPSGVEIAENFLLTLSRLMDGITRSLRSTVLRMTKVTSQEISGSRRDNRICSIVQPSQSCVNEFPILKPVYDLANAGPRHRFTIVTDAGPLIVHNSILGLGYAMGWEKFQATVWNDEGIWLDDEFCKDIVKIYRKEKYPEIPMFWKSTNEAAIAAVEEGGEHSAGGAGSGQYTEIELVGSDIEWAIRVGKARNRNAQASGREDSHGLRFDPEMGERIHIHGAAGELAVCRMLGIEWPAHVDTYQSVPDVLNLEIETRLRPDYDLIARKTTAHSDPRRNLVHVTTCRPQQDPSVSPEFKYRIHGWWKNTRTRKQAWVQTHGGREAAHFIPSTELSRDWSEWTWETIPIVQNNGAGSISYFVDGPFLHCRLPSGRLLAYLYPEVHTKVSYRFSAKNARDKDCIVMFPAKVGVPMLRVRRHAEHLAKKQNKMLTDDPPESFLSPHLSFMGRDTYTHQWKRCGTHGGTLVENADQASSRDLLAESMWRIDQTDDFDLLLSIHDEVVAEAPIGTATLKEFEDLMAIVPWWAPGMPIGAEGWIGPRLRK